MSGVDHGPKNKVLGWKQRFLTCRLSHSARARDSSCRSGRYPAGVELRMWIDGALDVSHACLTSHQPFASSFHLINRKVRLLTCPSKSRQERIRPMLKTRGRTRRDVQEPDPLGCGLGLRAPSASLLWHFWRWARIAHKGTFCREWLRNKFFWAQRTGQAHCQGIHLVRFALLLGSTDFLKIKPPKTTNYYNHFLSCLRQRRWRGRNWQPEPLPSTLKAVAAPAALWGWR